MQLENQVCTLKHSQQFVAFGISQLDATFNWHKGKKGKYYLDLFAPMFEFDFPAFNVAELFIMLPESTICFRKGKLWSCKTTTGVQTKPLRTQAAALSAMLLFLLKNKAINIAEVNKKLKA